MATLNLNEKKIASAENLRLLSSLILSLSSKQGTIENKLINNWVASTAYIKDESFVIYDELLYVCKISNADNTFDKNKWTCLSPVIEELTKADIEALINLNPEEISKLSDLISTEIRLDKTFSSSDTYTRIQAAIDTAKEYTNNQLGKAVKPAYKVVASTSEVTETGYFYLISNGTNYDMYVLSSDGAVVSLGTSEVDLSNYYTKTEVDNDFLKKTDATSTYATITTVDDKVDKSNIATSLDDTVTDEQVTSALLAKTELDKLSTKLNGLINDTKITTTNTFSSDKIKAITNELRKFILSKTDYQGIEAYPTECGVYRVTKKIDGIPNDASQYAALIIYGNGYFTHIFHDVISGRIWIGYTADSVKAPAWQEIATMDKVKDGYAKIIKNGDTDTDDAMFIAYKNNNLFGIRIYKNDNSEHELRFSESGISYVKNGVTIWTK